MKNRKIFTHALTPEKTASYLTPLKSYRIQDPYTVFYNQDGSIDTVFFHILDDKGNQINCKSNGDAHILHEKWEFFEEDSPEIISFESATHVLAPDNCSTYLTAGKCYKIALKDLEKKSFMILDDYRVALICRAQGCAHLNNQDWIFKAIELE